MCCNKSLWYLIRRKTWLLIWAEVKLCGSPHQHGKAFVVWLQLSCQALCSPLLKNYGVKSLSQVDGKEKYNQPLPRVSSNCSLFVACCPWNMIFSVMHQNLWNTCDVDITQLTHLLLSSFNSWQYLSSLLWRADWPFPLTPRWPIQINFKMNRCTTR